MTCTHDIVERDVAVTADGYCPLCMAAEITRLTAQNVEAWAERDAYMTSNVKLVAEVERGKVLLQRERGELHAVRAANVQLTAALRDATGLERKP